MPSPQLAVPLRSSKSCCPEKAGGFFGSLQYLSSQTRQWNNAGSAISKTRLVLEMAWEKPAFWLVFPLHLRLLFQKLKFWKSFRYLKILI
jgi:hypothetical protein